MNKESFVFFVFSSRVSGLLSLSFSLSRARQLPPSSLPSLPPSTCSSPCQTSRSRGRRRRARPGTRRGGGSPGPRTQTPRAGRGRAPAAACLCPPPLLAGAPRSGRRGGRQPGESAPARLSPRGGPRTPRGRRTRGPGEGSAGAVVLVLAVSRSMSPPLPPPPATTRKRPTTLRQSSSSSLATRVEPADAAQ